LSFNNNKSTYKEFCGCLEPTFVAFGGFFFEFLIPFILKGHNFLNFISFLTIFNASDMPIERIQILFIHQKQWSCPLGFGLPWVFKCYNHNSITTNEQLKDLTHMFCFWIPCHKLCKEGLFFCVFKLKYMCNFGMSWKKLNLNAKHNCF